MIREGKFGRMTALRGNKIESASLDEAVGELKRLDEEIYRIAEIFFG
jgi:6-phosphofructokinase 1